MHEVDLKRMKGFFSKISIGGYVKV